MASNSTWTQDGKIYRLLIDGQTAAKIEPRLKQFLLTLHLHNRDTYLFNTSVQKLMDHAEKELKVGV